MTNDGPITVGWREWLALPDLGVPAIRAKIDSGARSSALHVDALVLFEDGGGRRRARFRFDPDRQGAMVEAEAEVIDVREVTDSGGRTTRRPFIRTTLALAGQRWPIEMNLTNRTNMLFPMLLGRTAMSGRLRIDPSRSFLLGKAGHA